MCLLYGCYSSFVGFCFPPRGVALLRVTIARSVLGDLWVHVTVALTVAISHGVSASLL